MYLKCVLVYKMSTSTWNEYLYLKWVHLSLYPIGYRKCSFKSICTRRGIECVVPFWERNLALTAWRKQHRGLLILNIVRWRNGRRYIVRLFSNAKTIWKKEVVRELYLFYRFESLSSTTPLQYGQYRSCNACGLLSTTIGSVVDTTH